MHIDAHFNFLKFNLQHTLKNKDVYKKELLSIPEEACGFFIVRISTECTLLLDQFIEIVWKKFGDLEDKERRLYFPVFYEEKKFNSRMKKIRIDLIKDQMPDLVSLIESVQPFKCGESWLSKQWHIANERHSEPNRVYKNPNKIRQYLNFPGREGTRIKISVPHIDGNTYHLDIRKYAVQDKAPPKYVIKGKDEAADFIENCISETNSLICNMISCFERRLS